MAGDETTFRIILEEDAEPGTPVRAGSASVGSAGGLPRPPDLDAVTSDDIDSLRFDFTRNVRMLTDQFLRSQFGFLPFHEFRRTGATLTFPQMLQPQNRLETLNQLFAARYATSPQSSQYAQLAGQVLGVRGERAQAGIAGIESLLSGRATATGGSAGGAMAAAAIASAIGQTFEKFVAVSNRAAHFAGTASPANVLDKTATAAADVTEKFGVLGRITGGLIRSFNDMRNSFTMRAQEISGFSGQMAVASARADVRRLMFDIREAQAMGPQYARFINVQSQAETRIAEALLPVKTKVLELLSSILEKTSQHSDKIGRIIEFLTGPAIDVADKIAAMIFLLLELIPLGKQTADEQKAERERKRLAEENGAIAMWNRLCGVPGQAPLPDVGMPAPAPGPAPVGEAPPAQPIAPPMGLTPEQRAKRDQDVRDAAAALQRVVNRWEKR